MSRRGAGAARRIEGTREAPEIDFLVTPALGEIVIAAARRLMAGGMRPAEASSLFTQVAAHLAQQGPSRLSRDEWLTLCAVLWDGPGGEHLVSAPGGDA